MLSTERPSFLKDAIKLATRVAAPLTLTYLAIHAVYRISDGKPINLAIPANRQPVKTTEERRMIGLLRLVDQHIRRTWDRHGLEVEYEAIAVSGDTENPARPKNALPHHRPDLTVALRGTLPCSAPTPINDSSRIAVFEVGEIIFGNEDKVKQADHASRAGLRNYQQFDGNGITQLFRDFSRDPDGTTLNLLGDALFR